MSSLVIRNGVVVTMNDRFEIVSGDVSVRDGRIAAIGASVDGPHTRTLDAAGGGRPTRVDPAEIVAAARVAARELAGRAGV